MRGGWALGWSCCQMEGTLPSVGSLQARLGAGRWGGGLCVSEGSCSPAVPGGSPRGVQLRHCSEMQLWCRAVCCGSSVHLTVDSRWESGSLRSRGCCSVL